MAPTTRGHPPTTHPTAAANVTSWPDLWSRPSNRPIAPAPSRRPIAGTIRSPRVRQANAPTHRVLPAPRRPLRRVIAVARRKLRAPRRRSPRAGGTGSGTRPRAPVLRRKTAPIGQPARDGAGRAAATPAPCKRRLVGHKTALECGCSSGVEHHVANVRVVGSNPIARSNFPDTGGTQTARKGLFSVRAARKRHAKVCPKPPWPPPCAAGRRPHRST